MKKITKKFWQDFVQKNACDSYGLVTCLCILILWEHQVKTKEEADKILSQYDLGLSGFQAESAINMAITARPTNWLDKTMVEVCTTN